MRSKKALINIISSFLLQIITIICGFIIPKLIIKTYGSNVNGIIVSIVQFLSFISLLESGFGPVIKSTLYKPIAKKDKATIEKILKASEKNFRSISYFFIIYIMLLIIILPILLNNEFDKLFAVSLIMILSINTFAQYYFGMTYRLYLQAEQRTYVISAIGTLVAILIRTIEFMYHSSKYILMRSVFYSFKILLLIALEMVIISFIIYKIPKFDIINYKAWIIQAIIVTSISSVVVLLLNCIIYKENVKNAIVIFKNILKRNK